MGTPGRKKFLNRDTWSTGVHISLYICREDKDFIDSFATASYRDITGVVRYAISLLRKEYNRNGAKRGI